MNQGTTTSPRCYLFALVDGGGTVPPELGAVRRLVERGHDVTVLAEDSIIEDVRATGATLRPWVQAPNRPSRLPQHDRRWLRMRCMRRPTSPSLRPRRTRRCCGTRASS